MFDLYNVNPSYVLSDTLNALCMYSHVLLSKIMAFYPSDISVFGVDVAEPNFSNPFFFDINFWWFLVEKRCHPNEVHYLFMRI